MPLRQVFCLILSVLFLGACAWRPSIKFWEKAYEYPQGEYPVEELRRALLCGTPTENAVIRLFDSAAELTAWDSENALHLQRLKLPPEQAFVLVEQGLRRTGGYSIELGKTAELDAQGTLRLSAEWLQPAADRMVTQIMTSLCVLAAVPALPYRRVEVLDAEGRLQAFRDIPRE